MVGCPVSGRNRLEVETLIGLFINTLVLRTNLSGDLTFRELLGQVRKVVIGALAHQELPFQKLIEQLQPERDPSRTPLFQVLLQLRNVRARVVETGDLRLEEFEFDSGTAPFDLCLDLVEKPEGLLCVAEYNTDLFDGATISRLLGHFRQLLDEIVTDPERPIGRLPMLTKAERHQLLVEWNQTEADYPRDKCIHELFEAQAEREPGATALVFGTERWTYRELNRRANQVAHYLRSLGIGPDIPVGIAMERSADMVVVMLGILKAGGAYVALDPSYPAGRLQFILADTEAPVLVTQQHLAQRLSQHSARSVFVDQAKELIDRQPDTNPVSQVTPDHLAYVIYTSGSTGKPKGVAIEHRGVVSLFCTSTDLLCTESLAGMLAATSISFDISVREIFGPLAWGGKIILATSLFDLPDLPAADEVKTINTVPSAMVELLRMGSIPTSVHTVWLVGEILSNALAQRVYQLDHVREVYNLYGPTEATLYSTYSLVEKEADHNPSIGRPVKNEEVYVLDTNLQPVPIGVPGELYLGGVGLARGYVNRPELTAEKFVAHPFGSRPGARLYKTGDLVRYLPDGDLQFIGRLDHQVKIRGFRVELGEIEAVLAEHPSVGQSVVTMREDRPGVEHLVAYCVAAAEQQLSRSELRRFLKEKLPDYMIPSVVVPLDALPLLPNGKVDRQKLPAPEPARLEPSTGFIAPRTPLEADIAGIMAKALGIERVGACDNFFELGGHSLLVTRVVSEIRDKFRVELPIRVAFEAPTVEGLALAITQIWADQVGHERMDEILSELQAMPDDDGIGDG